MERQQLVQEFNTKTICFYGLEVISYLIIELDRGWFSIQARQIG